MFLDHDKHSCSQSSSECCPRHIPARVSFPPCPSMGSVVRLTGGFVPVWQSNPTLMNPAQATTVGFQPLQGMGILREGPRRPARLSLPRGHRGWMRGGGGPGEGNTQRGRQTRQSMAQKPALKCSRAQLHHLGRFISLPETLSPQNISPTVLCHGPVLLALLWRCSRQAGTPLFPTRGFGQ